MAAIDLPSSRESAILITDLTKTFRDNRALDGLTLQINKGELFGLVGPDGAGKTTLMRLLAGIMRPTSGEAWVAGHSIVTDPEMVKENIGYMSQRFGLYEDLTVMENLTFYADLFDVPQKERPQRMERLLGFSNLTPFKQRLAGNLSGGMKQKLGLACALIHTPRILLLDEPTNGVDPVSRRDFWRILYDLLKEEITVFVSTAYLDEAERCSRIALIHKGRILAVDEPATIRKSMTRPMIEIECSDAVHAAEIIAGMEGVFSISAYGNRVHVTVAHTEVASALAGALRLKGVEVLGTRSIAPSLEDVFISMVEQQ